MSLLCGLDRSGTPDPKERKATRELYVIGFAGVVAGKETLQVALSDLRHECGMRATKEFHGRDCPEWIRAEFLRRVQGLGLQVAVAAYEKGTQPVPDDRFQSPMVSQSRAALKLLDKFVQQHQLSYLWCDEDIQGKAAQGAFEAAAQQCHRAAWPNTRMKARHVASNESDIVQVADMLVYSFSRWFRGQTEDAELAGCLSEINRATGNIVLGPMRWGEWD